MPRVHQMRTDLAQYYNSTKPSLRLQYVTGLDDKINFQIHGTELLARELNIFATTKVNQKAITEQIRSLALSNNTAGASIYDLANLVKADSLADITHTLKSIEDKTNKAKQQEQDAALQQQQMVQQAETERQQAAQAFEAEQNALDRASEEHIAEIRAAFVTGGQDINANKQSDYLDTLEFLDKKDMGRQQIALKKEAEINKQINNQTTANLKREELATRERIANKQVQVASINKNKYDKK